MSTLTDYYMDLHIHIGRTKSGKPVKITASNQLTLQNILDEALRRKGLDIVGVIDAHSPEVLDEITELVDTGYGVVLKDGGIRYLDQLTLILGSEVEIYDINCHGPIHVLCFFPTIDSMRDFSDWCKKRMKNIQLSSQRIYTTGLELQHYVKELEGLFIPAHIFTPFKSLYGKGVKISLQEVFDPNLIDAVELGLSSNTDMADQLLELKSYPFITNSDAHSLKKIGREHQIITLSEASFSEIEKAFKGEGGRKIQKNVGLYPRLGKYYHSVCSLCDTLTVDQKCPTGHEGKIIRGVSERIEELAKTQRDNKISLKKCDGVKRPEYLHQVPLEFIPGCGPKTIDRLLEAFHSEMNVIHKVTMDELLLVVQQKVAKKIILARSGELSISEGGGGVFGKIN